MHRTWCIKIIQFNNFDIIVIFAALGHCYSVLDLILNLHLVVRLKFWNSGEMWKHPFLVVYPKITLNGVVVPVRFPFNTRGITVIVLKNGKSNLSSNPEWSSFSFILHNCKMFRMSHEFISSLPTSIKGKILVQAGLFNPGETRRAIDDTVTSVLTI